MKAADSQERAQEHERGARFPRHLHVIAVAVGVAFVLGGCSGKKHADAAASADAKRASASTSRRESARNTSSTTNNRTAGTTGTTGGSGPQGHVQPASTPLVAAWCRLRLGATAAELKRAMGAPNGNDAASYKDVLPPGTNSLEWDAGNDVFVASLAGDRAVILQAYDRKVGPVIGARDLPCNAYRRK